MKRTLRARGVDAVVAIGLMAAMPCAVHAEIQRTGDEPWYREPDADIPRAKALFAQAVDKHQQLVRGDARDLYDQALELWDNPDIRWNLALVLEDLGQYLRAHEQLDVALRWGDALGAERLREVRDRMQALEARHLARIEASSDEPGAEITLDGQPWFRGAGRKSKLVEPGEHYVAARKEGFFPVTRSVSVAAGHAARGALAMDADRLVETRRWPAWRPWIVVTAGAVVTVVGAELAWQASRYRDNARRSFPDACDQYKGCDPRVTPAGYDRAVTDQRLAIAAFVVGGTALAVGLTMAWVNQLEVHRTEAHAPDPIEVMPVLSADQAGLSARLQF